MHWKLTQQTFRLGWPSRHRPTAGAYGCHYPKSICGPPGLLGGRRGRAGAGGRSLSHCNNTALSSGLHIRLQLLMYPIAVHNGWKHVNLIVSMRFACVWSVWLSIPISISMPAGIRAGVWPNPPSPPAPTPKEAAFDSLSVCESYFRSYITQYRLCDGSRVVIEVSKISQLILRYFNILGIE